MQVVADLEGVKLIFDAGGALLKIFQVFGRPPVAQISLGIVLAALIVEAVGHLMADDGADAAIVERIVGLRIEEGRLQDAGGKYDFVQLADCSKR